MRDIFRADALSYSMRILLERGKEKIMLHRHIHALGGRRRRGRRTQSIAYVYHSFTFLSSSTSIFKSIRRKYMQRWTTEPFSLFVISLVYVMKRRRIDINQALCPSSTVVSQWPIWEVTDGKNFLCILIDRYIDLFLMQKNKLMSLNRQKCLP